MERERLISRRCQGDIGEASAIEWLLSRGATVAIPFGHSPDFDLLADLDGSILRIQVKTTTQSVRTPKGDARSPVALATSGGNQSWTGIVKRMDGSRFEFLFVLTGDGRRWLIPAHSLEARNAITLGGPKYAEYEIEPGRPIDALVHGDGSSIESPRPGGVSKRSTDGACKASGSAFAGSNPASPITKLASDIQPPVATGDPVKPTNYERKPGQRGEAVINQKRRLTIPQRPFFEAGFQNGGRVRVRAEAPGRLVVEQIELPAWARPRAPDRAG